MVVGVGELGFRNAGNSRIGLLPGFGVPGE
jgi:hypothetical protein